MLNIMNDVYTNNRRRQCLILRRVTTKAAVWGKMLPKMINSHELLRYASEDSCYAAITYENSYCSVTDGPPSSYRQTWGDPAGYRSISRPSQLSRHFHPMSAFSWLNLTSPPTKSLYGSGIIRQSLWSFSIICIKEDLLRMGPPLQRMFSWQNRIFPPGRIAAYSRRMFPHLKDYFFSCSPSPGNLKQPSFIPSQISKAIKFYHS